MTYDKTTDFLTLLGAIQAGNIKATGNTISTTNANGNLTLAPNGSGLIGLGGSTSAFPAFQWPGALGILSIKAADNSTWAIVNAQRFRIFDSNANAPTATLVDVGVELKSDGLVCWSGNSTDATQSKAACVKKTAAGRLAVTDGSSGGGVLLGVKGSDVPSANNISLAAANYFVVTGTTQVNTISATNWTAGSCVVLQFSGSLTVKNATAGTGAQLKLSGSADFSATADDTLQLCYDGTTWREVSRTVI
jgi:hypothetical protein